MQVDDGPGEQCDSKEQHGDAAPDDRTAAADERGTTCSIREAAMVMTSPAATMGRMKGRPGVRHQGRDPQRNEGQRARSAGVLAAGGKWWL